MKKEMLINVLQPEEIRIAILEDGTLEELYVERTSHESFVGNIYKGRIVNIEPSIQAVFVDFGVGRNGFLHVSDVEPAYYQHLENAGRSRRDSGRGERGDRGDRRGGGRGERSERSERSDRGERGRSDRSDRSDRGRGGRKRDRRSASDEFDDLERRPVYAPEVEDLEDPIHEIPPLSAETQDNETDFNEETSGFDAPNYQPETLEASDQESNDIESTQASDFEPISPASDSEDLTGRHHEHEGACTRFGSEMRYTEIQYEPIVESPIESPREDEPRRGGRAEFEALFRDRDASPAADEPAPGEAMKARGDDSEEEETSENNDVNGNDEPPLATVAVEGEEKEAKPKRRGRAKSGRAKSERGRKTRAKESPESPAPGSESAPPDGGETPPLMGSAEHRTEEGGDLPENPLTSRPDFSDEELSFSLAPRTGDATPEIPAPAEPAHQEDDFVSQVVEAVSAPVVPAVRETPKPPPPPISLSEDDLELSFSRPRFVSPVVSEPVAESREAIEPGPSLECEPDEELADEFSPPPVENERLPSLPAAVDDFDDEFADYEPRRGGSREGGGEGDRDRRGGRRGGGGRDAGRRPSGGGRPGMSRPKPLIQDIFKRGQEVLVQVIKEGIGTKGPTLSTYISIAGRYLVLMPGLARIGVSRKIEDEDTRKRLREIMGELQPPKGLGFIIRTAGQDRNRKELQGDLAYLSRLWQVVVRRIKSQKSPCEIYQESDMITRTIRDIFTNDIETIWVDEPNAFQQAREFLQIVMPRYANRIKLWESKEPMFHKHGIEQEISRIQQRHVPLNLGGSIVIDQTEALVAIDVNSGNFRADNNAEETAYQMNLQAAKEIARQLRLRDLGGVIVNDFIDMREERHRRGVEKALRDAIARDRARTKVLRMSQFGIIEMTRQRIRPSLKRSVSMDCPHCHGMGQIKTVESMSIEGMRLVQLAIHKEHISRVEIRVHEPVAQYLLNRKRKEITNLEDQSGKSVTVHAVTGVSPEFLEFLCFDNHGNEVKFTPFEDNRFPTRRRIPNTR